MCDVEKALTQKGKLVRGAVEIGTFTSRCSDAQCKWVRSLSQKVLMVPLTHCQVKSSNKTTTKIPRDDGLPCLPTALPALKVALPTQQSSVPLCHLTGQCQLP